MAAPDLGLAAELTAVSRRHALGGAQVAADIDVDLRLATGESVAVTGPSGAGKTTLLNLGSSPGSGRSREWPWPRHWQRWVLLGLFVLVATGVDSRLDTSVLGTALDIRVRGFHMLLGSLVMLVGSLAAAQFMLQANQGRRRRLAGYVGLQCLVIGGAGIAAAVATALMSGRLLASPGGAIALGVGTSVGAGLVATMVAAVGPLVWAWRATPLRLMW